MHAFLQAFDDHARRPKLCNRNGCDQKVSACTTSKHLPGDDLGNVRQDNDILSQPTVNVIDAWAWEQEVIAGSPVHVIVALFAVKDIVAEAAVEVVVARGPEEEIISEAASQNVVAVLSHDHVVPETPKNDIVAPARSDEVCPWACRDEVARFATRDALGTGPSEEALRSRHGDVGCTGRAARWGLWVVPADRLRRVGHCVGWACDAKDSK